ncbi:TOBE domain-containing protein [Microtetraspora malaysiensis]
MTTFRISEAAVLLGVSSDTLRRTPAELDLTPGQQVWASVKATETHAHPA